MTTLCAPTPFVKPPCPECAGHGYVPSEFGGVVACPKCDDRPAAVTMTLVDLPALCRRFEAAADEAEFEAEHHGAQHQRDTRRGVALGLRQAVDILRATYGAPADLAERYEQLAAEAGAA